MKVNKIRFVDKSLRVKFPMFKFVHCFKSRFNAKCDRRTIVLLQLLDKGQDMSGAPPSVKQFWMPQKYRAVHPKSHTGSEVEGGIGARAMGMTKPPSQCGRSMH